MCLRQAEQGCDEHDSIDNAHELEDPAPAEVSSYKSSHDGDNVAACKHDDREEAHSTTPPVREEEICDGRCAERESDWKEAIDDSSENDVA